MSENNRDMERELFEVRASTESTATELTQIRKALEGNGRPGLVQDVAKAQVQVETLEKRCDVLQSRIENMQKFMMGSLFTALLAIITSIGSALVGK